jgi:hypothetical protein
VCGANPSAHRPRRNADRVPRRKASSKHRAETPQGIWTVAEVKTTAALGVRRLLSEALAGEWLPKKDGRILMQVRAKQDRVPGFKPKRFVRLFGRPRSSPSTARTSPGRAPALDETIEPAVGPGTSPDADPLFAKWDAIRAAGAEKASDGRSPSEDVIAERR